MTTTQRAALDAITEGSSTLPALMRALGVTKMQARAVVQSLLFAGLVVSLGGALRIVGGLR